jgi:hypothetical protein
MEQEGFVKKTVRSTVKWVKRLLLIALVLALGYTCVCYWGVYEKGTMAGKVLRVTEKGYCLKHTKAKSAWNHLAH